MFWRFRAEDGKDNQKGFSAVEGLVVLGIIAIVGLAGWFIWQRNNKTNNTASNQQNAVQIEQSQEKTNVDTVDTPSDPYAGWLSICDEIGIGCVKYPNDWKILEDYEGQKQNVQFVTTDNSGNNVNVNFSLYGICGEPVNPLATYEELSTHELTKPVDGILIHEGIDSDIYPRIAMHAIECHPKTNQGWHIDAQPFFTDTSSTAAPSREAAVNWFSTVEANTALKIMQSFTFQ